MAPICFLFLIYNDVIKTLGIKSYSGQAFLPFKGPRGEGDPLYDIRYIKLLRKEEGKHYYIFIISQL